MNKYLFEMEKIECQSVVDLRKRMGTSLGC